MKNILTKNIFLLFVLLFSSGLMAQTKITGTVSDKDGNLYFGVNVVEKGTYNGAITDLDGKFEINVSKLPATLVFSYVGFTDNEVEVTDASKPIMVTISEGIGLDEVVVTGNRTKPRTVLDSPVPIDNISADELKRSGQVSVDQMLTYKVPSYNAANQAISDATAHFDPADLRGLGPSRTLVLVNGKRKNASAQIYLNGTPGKGEVGTDMKSIPAAAIDHIEVLRDGASAQYGSDAIAGVINIVLKDNVEYTTVSTTTGVTKEGDGFNFGVDLNTAVQIGEKGGLNFTMEYYDQKLTNRAGAPGTKDLPENPRQNWIDWATNNPRLGMIVGQPDLTKKSIMVNGSFPLNDKVEFYTFHAYTHRDGRSFAYYRAPYWRGDVEDSEYITPLGSFEGYHPTFEAEVIDNLSSGGLKFDLGGFAADASVTYGRNYVDYTVNRSVNRDYLADHGWSPRTFHPGGYMFSNVVGNLDFSRSFSDMVSLSFGAEAKKERFSGHKGDEFSYYKGGSDSFAGIKPFEAVNKTRTSYAGYAALDFDISEALLLGGAARFENFDDFGNNLSWKVNGRYKIGNKGAIRASVSTGFRAPSLHQKHIQLSQYIIVPGFPDPQLQGTLPNDNAAVEGLGVPKLFAETSFNLAGGITYKLSDHMSLTADFYQIKVKDRVLFSSQIKELDGSLDGSDPIEQILLDNGVVALQFFINAVNTKTTGTDIVLNAQNYTIGNGKFGVSLAANFNNTEIDGAVTNPAKLEAGGYEIFNRREAGRITDARPKSKILLGMNYSVGNLSLTLNNTRFGEVTVFDDTDPAKDQVHSAKIATDVILGYNISDNVSFNVIANNIFDVYPDILHKDLRSAGGRFLYSSEVTQLGFLGTNYKVGLTVKF